MRGSRGDGGQGVQTPLENHKAIGFMGNTGLDPEAAKPTSSACQRNAIPVGVFAGKPMMGYF